MHFKIKFICIAIFNLRVSYSDSNGLSYVESFVNFSYVDQYVVDTLPYSDDSNNRLKSKLLEINWIKISGSISV